MFKVKQLKVKDWCQHVDRVVDFVPGTNGVIGTNGKGKSNLISAIFTAITGRVLLEPADANINYKADKATIDLTFTHNNVDGTIRRVFNAPYDELTNVREDMKSTAELVFGTADKIKKSAAVTDAMERLTGMAATVVRDHVFISQTELSSLLFQSKGDRLNSFLKLIPGTKRAEDLRKILQDELNRYPEVMTEDASHVRETIQIIRVEIEALKAALAAATDELKDIDVAAAVALLAKVKDVRAAELKFKQLQSTVDALRASNDDSQVHQALADTKLAEMINLVSLGQSSADAARVELQTIASNIAMYKARQTVVRELDELTAAIGGVVVPDDRGCPWNALTNIESECQALTHRQLESQRALSLLSKGDVCPTCSRPFENAAAERTKHQAVLAEVTPAITQLTVARAKLVREREEFTTASAKYNAWLDSTEKRLASLTAQLETLPDVPAPTPEHTTRMQAEISAHEAAKAKLRTLEVEAIRWGDTLMSTEAKLETLEPQLKDLEAVVATLPEHAQITAAEVLQQRHQQLYNTSNELQGRLAAKNDELTRTEANLLRIEVAAEKSKNVTEYRALISDSRDVLHKERLQQEVLMTYVQQLDTLCNKFLDVFGNPFAIVLDKDMDMQCHFANGYVCAADRLSGGQKCVLSIAMRFAINELFAKDLGLLILDEPAAYLDNDNIAYVGDLMQQVHKLGQQSGVQTIVVTHEQDLIPCFEHIIKV